MMIEAWNLLSPGLWAEVGFGALCLLFLLQLVLLLHLQHLEVGHNLLFNDPWVSLVLAMLFTGL